MSHRRLSTRGIAACLALVFAAVPIAAEPFQLADDRAVVRLHSKIALAPREARAFRALRSEGNFNAAVYYNTEDGVLYFYQNGHSQASALEHARKYCRTNARNASSCVLYATIVPSNAPADPRVLTLNRASAKSFRNYRKLVKKGVFAAFAINNQNADGYAWQFQTEAEAREAALLECAATAHQALAKMTKQQRDTLANSRDFACRVIHIGK